MGKMKLISELIKERDDLYKTIQKFKEEQDLTIPDNIDVYMHMVESFNYSCECLEHAFHVRYTDKDISEDLRDAKDNRSKSRVALDKALFEIFEGMEDSE